MRINLNKYVNCNPELINKLNEVTIDFKNEKKLFNEKNSYQEIKDNNYEISIELKNNLPEQEYHCTLNVRDLAGNTKYFSIDNFTVDVTKPNLDYATDSEGNLVKNDGTQIKLTNKKLDIKFDDIILAETLTVSNSDDCSNSNSSIILTWKDSDPDSDESGCVGLIPSDTQDGNHFSYTIEQTKWAVDECPMYLGEGEECRDKVYLGPDRVYTLSFSNSIKDKAENHINITHIEFSSQEKLKVETADYPVIEENGEIRTRNTLHTSGSLDIYFNKKINPSFFTDNGNGISDKLIDNILISVKYENQTKENLSSRDFVYSHAFTEDDKSLLTIKRPEGQRLADNATYSFLFGDQIYSHDEINFEGYAVQLWMTSDSVPPVLNKIEIYSNNDNDTKIAKLGDVVTFHVTSIEDVYKPTVLINSNTISSDDIYYSSV